MSDEAEEIDRLITELNATAEPALGSKVARGDIARLEAWLGFLAARGGSELLLVGGGPPALRLDGKVVRLAEVPSQKVGRLCP